MIPILYSGTEKDFLNNGLGRLSDAIKCTVEEERNGTYELEMTYPITGIHFDDIQENNIIYAPSEDGGVNQAFIIYKISKPLNGIVTINAQHISYLLNGFVVMPYTASSLADALNKINANSVPETGFTFSTDVSLSKPFTLDSPRSIRSLLGGQDGSLLDVYGGHDYYFNNFSVQLLAHRGNDNGVTIRYGKNLTDLKAVSDTTSVYTGIVPFWADTEGGNVVYVDGYVVYSEHAATYPYKYIKPVDFSSDFETAPSKAQLLARAESYLENNEEWKIKSNIEVSFVSLAQTEEYKNIAPLERVKLCDTVTVVYDKLGISFKTRVIKTVYNVLLNRYDSIELGDTTYTLAQAILQANDTPTLQETTSAIQSAVQNATKLIRGGLGGHVVMMADGNGLPQEILIMDTDDITTAQKVWRWNLGGLGYSNEGYDGDYGTAITMDGQIVANFITTGTLNAALIKAGVLAAEDENPQNYWNMQTGEFHLVSNANVGQGITIDAQGNLVINGSYIQANTISAESLTAQARKDLEETHNYLVNNVFSDISVWHTDGGVTPFSYETIDGVKYLVIDGANVTTANRWNDVVYTALKLSGDIALKIHFVYYIDTAITISTARHFPVVDFYKRDGSNRITYYNIPAQSVPANTEFTWDITLTPTSVDADMPANFGFYPLPNCKMYIKELTVTSSIDSYATSGMNFNSDGLELLATKVEQDNTHSYLPYDFMENTDRWVTYSTGTWHGGIGIGFVQVTSGGKTVTAMQLDGTSITGTGEVYKKLTSDLVGATTFNYSFNIQVTSDVTFSSDFDLFDILLTDRDSGNSTLSIIEKLTSGTQLTADTEYSYSGSFTPSNIDPNSTVPAFLFQFVKTNQIKIYNIQITSTAQIYKNATLKYTADGLDSVVMAGSIMSQINQSAEQVQIKASKIDLQGDLSLHGDFTSYDPNYDPNDPTTFTYAFMDSGSISFFYENANVFTIAALPLLGNNAGIFFGDAEDPQTLARYTYLTQDYCQIPTLLVRKDGSQVAPTAAGQAMIEGDFSVYGISKFYDTVYDANGGTVFISDKRKKRSIKDLAIEKARSFIMAIKPKVFKFTKDISKSDRNHHGFIAQEVKEAMLDDWGVYVEDKDTDFIGLRYDEMLADMVAVIQDQEKRIEALERAIHDKSNNKS